MIGDQNYRQLIQQQSKLENIIAQGWGYLLEPLEHITINKKLYNSKKVANIQPLKDVKQIPKSNRLKRIQEQITIMQNQKKLRILTEKAKAGLSDDQEMVSAAIHMMRQKIQEYNFIIEHRHIMQKNSDQARKILGIKKSQCQLIKQKIQLLQKQVKKHSLSDTIRINQEIAQLYRKYHQVVFTSRQSSAGKSIRALTGSQKQSHTQNSKHRTQQSYMGSSKLSPSFLRSPIKETQFDSSSPSVEKIIQLHQLKIMPELNQSQQGSIDQDKVDLKAAFEAQSLLYRPPGKMKRRITQYGARPRIYTDLDNPQQRADRQRKQKMNSAIGDVYVKKQIFDKGNKLDMQLQQHGQVLEVWKARVGENYQKNMAAFVKIEPKIKKQRSFRNKNKSEMQKKSSQTVVPVQVAPLKVQSKPKIVGNLQLKLALQNQQSILCHLLQKKQAKFKRVPGTQLLQKNDLKQKVKDYLGLKKQSRSISMKPGLKHAITQIREQLEQIPEWQNIQKNQDDYWLMCKNQKLNMLLRNKKGHK